MFDHAEGFPNAGADGRSTVCKYHWEKGLVSVLMKLFRKFKVSSNGPSTEWVGYEILIFYTSFLIVASSSVLYHFDRFGSHASQSRQIFRKLLRVTRHTDGFRTDLQKYRHRRPKYGNSARTFRTSLSCHRTLVRFPTIRTAKKCHRSHDLPNRLKWYSSMQCWIHEPGQFIFVCVPH
jgi:hypothetical protein